MVLVVEYVVGVVDGDFVDFFCWDFVLVVVLKVDFYGDLWLVVG